MKRRSPWAWIGLAVLLTVFVVRLTDAARQESFTIDEPHYVTVGQYLWKTGDYHWYYALLLQPPLAYHLAALPFLIVDAPDMPLERYGGWRFIKEARTPLETMRVAGRLPFIVLTAWGALLVFLWARDVAGPSAGLLGALLFTLSPAVAAYGALAHSDMAVTVFMFQTLYTFWRWWRARSPAWMVACGVSLGLALAAKMNALLLLPMLGLMMAILLARPGSAAPAAPRPWSARIGWAAAVLAAFGALALVVLWCAYGGSFRIAAEATGPFPGIPLPAYAHSLLINQAINEQGGRVYWFFGALAQPAWYFLPVAFLVKTPVPILLLAAAAALRRSAHLRDGARLGLFMGLPALIYAVTALFVVNVPAGVRFLLPLYPIVFVFIATALTGLRRRWQRIGVGTCLVWLVVVGIWVHPDYLAFFNAAAGGPSRGHHYFADSNLDWGQGLGALADWLEPRGNPPVHAALFTAQDPRAYGIRIEPLDGCTPQRNGLVAISASVRRGLYKPDGRFGRPQPDCYDWLDRYEPVAIPAYSILVYDLGPPY